MNSQEIRKLNNERLPRWYNWRVHLFFNILLFGLITFVGFFLISQITFYTVIYITIGFFAWSFMEYFIHRFVLHGNFSFKINFKNEHSFFHHGYFTKQDNYARNWFDINRILLRPLDVISVVFLNIVLSALLGLISSFEIGLILFISGNLYLICYELVHGMVHAKRDFILFKRLKQHHTAHHDLALMGRFNFSVVFPFIDKLFGTYYTVRDV